MKTKVTLVRDQRLALTITAFALRCYPQNPVWWGTWVDRLHFVSACPVFLRSFECKLFFPRQDSQLVMTLKLKASYKKGQGGYVNVINQPAHLALLWKWCL
jgi:hypothetical protein